MMAALVREAEANRQRDPELYNGLFPRVVQNPIGGMVEEIGERERAHVRAGVGAGSESDGESEQLVSRSESDAEDVSDSPLRHISGSGSSALPDFFGGNRNQQVADLAAEAGDRGHQDWLQDTCGGPAEDVSDSPLRHIFGSGLSALPDFFGGNRD